MEDIIGYIIAYKEDHPEVIMTRYLIQLVIEENINKLIDEIEENI